MFYVICLCFNGERQRAKLMIKHCNDLLEYENVWGYYKTPSLSKLKTLQGRI